MGIFELDIASYLFGFVCGAIVVMAVYSGYIMFTMGDD